MCVVQRSLKIADACMQSSIHVELFVDILNRYLFLFAEVQTTQFSCTRVYVLCVHVCILQVAQTAPYVGLFEMGAPFDLPFDLLLIGAPVSLHLSVHL